MEDTKRETQKKEGNKDEMNGEYVDYYFFIYFTLTVLFSFTTQYIM